MFTVSKLCIELINTKNNTYTDRRNVRMGNEEKCYVIE